MPRRKAVSDLEAIPVAWLKLMPAPVFVLGRQGRIKYANDAFIELTGYKREKVYGMRLDALFAYGSIQKALNDLLSVYRGRSLPAASYRLGRASGTVLGVTMALAPVFEGRNQAVTRVIGIVLRSSD
jgi:PAS domain S-box-containing protein